MVVASGERNRGGKNGGDSEQGGGGDGGRTGEGMMGLVTLACDQIVFLSLSVAVRFLGLYFQNSWCRTSVNHRECVN